jgi:hypothetical protein
MFAKFTPVYVIACFAALGGFNYLVLICFLTLTVMTCSIRIAYTCCSSWSCCTCQHGDSRCESFWVWHKMSSRSCLIFAAWGYASSRSVRWTRTLSWRGRRRGQDMPLRLPVIVSNRYSHIAFSRYRELSALHCLFSLRTHASCSPARRGPHCSYPAAIYPSPMTIPDDILDNHFFFLRTFWVCFCQLAGSRHCIGTWVIDAVSLSFCFRMFSYAYGISTFDTQKCCMKCFGTYRCPILWGSFKAWLIGAYRVIFLQVSMKI